MEAARLPPFALVDAIAHLERGGALAQILGSAAVEGQPTIAWLTIQRERPEPGQEPFFEVRVHLALDAAVEGPADPSGFRWIASEPNLVPEGCVVELVRYAEGVVRDLGVVYGAREDAFVALEALPEAYAEFARRGRPPRPHELFWQKREPAPDWPTARARMELYVEALFWQDLGIPRPEATPYIEWILERVVRPEIEKLLKAQKR